MAYIGIGNSGEDEQFLRTLVENNSPWLRGDRIPRFFGDRFLVLYDSNTAREFAKKCVTQSPHGTITIYPMERPLES
jgi:hypothetical protein